MTDAWAKGHREGWLCRFYGDGQSDGTRKLSEDSPQWQLVGVIETLLLGTVSPKDSAAKTAFLITSADDPDTPWQNHLGISLSAAEKFGDEKQQKALVDYIVELASLPNPINEGPGVKTWIRGEGEIIEQVCIQPGEPILIDGLLLRDMPAFAMNVTERFQGPEAYLSQHNSPASPSAATATWKNINTFCALLATHPEAQAIPALAGYINLGFTTLAMALESAPNSRLGKNVKLHTPAAAVWLRIAGDTLEQVCGAETKVYFAGDLWKVRGGMDVCSSARLEFWKARMREEGYEEQF